MQYFLIGAMAMASWTAMLFFLRFWRDTRDRLFAMFAAAFFLLGMTRLGLTLMHDSAEGQTYFYWLRLVAYLLILAAIIDKNHQTAANRVPRG